MKPADSGKNKKNRPMKGQPQRTVPYEDSVYASGVADLLLCYADFWRARAEEWEQNGESNESAIAKRTEKRLLDLKHKLLGDSDFHYYDKQDDKTRFRARPRSKKKRDNKTKDDSSGSES